MNIIIVKGMVENVDNAGMPANSTVSTKGIGGKCVHVADIICNMDKVHSIDKY